MYASRTISKPRHHRTSHCGKNQPLIVAQDGGHPSPPEVLNCVPLPGSRGNLLQFYSFDEEYFGRLREGDFLTRDHFHKYFTALMRVKLRSRLHSREAIEDVQQETFVRFFKALRDEKIKEPTRLGSYVVSICKNVLKGALPSRQGRRRPLRSDRQGRCSGTSCRYSRSGQDALRQAGKGKTP